MQAIIVCNFKENYWTKFEKMTKKTCLGPDFGLSSTDLGPKDFFVNFTSTTC